MSSGDSRFNDPYYVRDVSSLEPWESRYAASDRGVAARHIWISTAVNLKVCEPQVLVRLAKSIRRA